MHILITGGAGFIGSHIAQLHLERNDHVWVIDDLSTGLLENISPFLQHPHFRFENKNILSSTIDDPVFWSDKIYHMAAWVGQTRVLHHQTKTLHDNIAGCECLLESVAKSAKNTRVLIASSSSVYGHPSSPICKEGDIIHISPTTALQEAYPLSKLVNEITALAFVREKKLDCCIARIFNTVGPRQRKDYGMCLPTFLDQALHNKPITIFGDGSQMRSFCNVKDTAVACSLLLDTPLSKGEIVNIGLSEEISIQNLAIEIKRRTQSSSPIVHIPYDEAYRVPFQESIFEQLPSLEKLKKITGFQPSISIGQSIEELASLAKSS